MFYNYLKLIYTTIKDKKHLKQQDYDNIIYNNNYILNNLCLIQVFGANINQNGGEIHPKVVEASKLTKEALDNLIEYLNNNKGGNPQLIEQIKKLIKHIELIHTETSSINITELTDQLTELTEFITTYK